MEGLSQDTQEFTGVVTLITATVLNIWNMVASVPLNGWFVIFTSIGGLVYLYWKIVTQKKESRLKDLEIERELLEIERLKSEN